MKGSRAWLGWLLGGALLLAGAAQEQRRAERGPVAGHGSKRHAKAPLRRAAARVTKPARPQERTPPATRPRAHGLAARPTARAREATRSRRAFEALYASGSLLRRCEGAGKRVALTFDDGPAPVTPEVLAILARHHARATFFVVGKRVRRFPQALRAIARAGHQLENHTWSHELGRPYTRRCFVLEGPRHQREEVERTDRAIGHPTRYLRVPGGLFTSRSSVPEVAHALHKVVVNWMSPATPLGPRTSSVARSRERPRTTCSATTCEPSDPAPSS